MKKSIKNRYAMYLICLLTITFILQLFYLRNMISSSVLIFISLSLNLVMLLSIFLYRKKINNIYIIIAFIIFSIYNTLNMFILIYPPNNLTGNRISFVLFILFVVSFYKSNNTK